MCRWQSQQPVELIPVGDSVSSSPVSGSSVSSVLCAVCSVPIACTLKSPRIHGLLSPLLDK